MQHPSPAKSKAAWESLSTKWDKRAKLAAEWLQAEDGVADIGCGLMSLELFLPATTVYVPMDLVRRDSRTVVIDLRTEPIPEVACSTAVMLGVLEYLEDAPLVLRQLARFEKSVISYNHRAVNDVLWSLGLRKKRVDWVSRYQRSSFRQLIVASGLRVTRERRIRVGERLYEVRPV